jgi:putative Mn2+ efflux pump MntP
VSGFLFAFIAVLLAACGARDQAVLAQLTLVQGRRPMLLAVALASALATTAFAGWAALRLVPEMAGAARSVLGAIALVVAGGEMVLLGPPRRPAEPTNSLFAALLVLAGWQVGDAARLLVLAIGVATAAPVPAALGGGLASLVMLALGWMVPAVPLHPLLRSARIAAGLLMMVIGALIFIA